MWPVFVLLWKHCIMRKRLPTTLFYDYVLPLLGYLAMWWIVYTRTDEWHTLQKTKMYSYNDLLREYEEGSVLYSPQTALTDRLMEEVGARLNLERLDHLPRENETGYFPLSNASTLEFLKYSEDMHSDIAIVIFEDMESDKWPEKLKYTIRMKTDFKSNDDEYKSTLPVVFDHHEHFGVESHPFMRVQWAIDTSYLHLATGADSELSLTLQELPFAAEQNPRALFLARFAIILLSFAMGLSFVYLTERLVEGKNTGTHELVKIAGVSWEALSVSYILDMVPPVLIHSITGVLFYKLTDFIPNTNGGFIFAAIALHDLSIVILALPMAYVFNITQYIQLIATAIIFALWGLSIFILKVESRVISLLTDMIPHCAFMRFWMALGTRELTGDGITLSNMSDLVDHQKTTVLEHYVCMTLQIIVFYLLAWYLSRVRPGRYGQPLPWSFPCTYWSRKPQAATSQDESQVVRDSDQRYFEKAPPSLPVGMKIIDISKSFGKERVLHGVNLELYRGEIAVLLGHNGAGKTTLINIITGLIPASSGQVLVEGKDSFTQAAEVRNLIGLCPQQNVFFTELTVIEHIRLFAMLKGQTYPQSLESATVLASKLQLSDKEDMMIEELSGGMKRRAQLACAVVGGASVLMLDEPTSGLDVETRHELWNLLLSLRTGRTVLLTTHFMEEADALGDRIAALHHGQVRCHATSMFLKRAIGTGYRLSFTTAGAPMEPEITAAITAVVPDATVRDKRPNAITYNLPAKDSARFPEMFAALEAKRSSLDIVTIGVGKSTLDDVFMEMCTDEKPLDTEQLDASVIEPEIHRKVTGPKLYARQCAVLLLRNWRYIITNVFTLIIVICLVAFMLWGYTYSSNKEPAVKSSTALHLERYAAPHRLALVNVDNESLEALRSSFSGVHFEKVPDVAAAALRTSRERGQMYNKCIFGIELNKTNAKVLYSPSVRHCAPVALNALSNAIARRAFRASVAARDRPLQGAFVPYSEANINLPKSGAKILAWTGEVAMVICMAFGSFSLLPLQDGATGARHAHVMAGAPRVLHWATTLTAHLITELLVCGVPLVMLVATGDDDATINQLGFMLALCMLLVLCTLALLGLVYLLCVVASQTIVSFLVMLGAIIFTRMTPLIPESSKWYPLVYVILMLMPPHTFATGLGRAAMLAQVNAYCKLNRDKCPILFGPGVFEAKKCCESPLGSEPWSYWTTSAAGWHMIILAGQALVYFTLTVLVDDGVLARMCAHARKSLPLRFRDAMVNEEAVYVERIIKLPNKAIPDAMLCYKLQKVYARYFWSRPFVAVRNISFSIKKGECFGLVGVNGAGKSTTFKMLTGETRPSSGKIFANGHFANDLNKYMRTLSYCPQFAGADDFQTGRQNLRLLLTLRGLSAADVSAVSAFWLQEVGLTAQADKRVSSYSGGLARRLAAAAALCQRVRVALLDEPTAGVDPLARRRMHLAMLRAKQSRALIVASHSLDEIEAVCHRITIMSGGELRALGSAAALKAQHGQGYSVVFKLSAYKDKEGKAILEEFKTQMTKRFACQLQAEYQFSLSYRIKDSLPYSQIFSELEQLRDQFSDLVEDYSVTETTLEEVFLALAKEARAQRTV